MAKFDAELAGRCVAIGIVAGLRSIAAPGVVLENLLRRVHDLPTGLPLSAPAVRRLAKLTLYGSIGEMLFDKLPFVPNRTSAPGLIFRCASGAASAGLLSSSRGACVIAGAAFGAIGALVGTFGGFHARKWVGDHTSIPDAVTAVAEDGITLALAKAAVYR